MGTRSRSVRDWAARHPAGVDGVGAVALAVVAAAELTAGRSQVQGPWWGQLACFLAMTGAVALRRRAVVLAAAVCGGGLVVQELLGPAPVVAGLLALLVVLYSAGAHGRGRRGTAALVVLLLALLVHPFTDPAARTIPDLVGNLAIFGGVWGLGRLVRHHREREAALAQAHIQLAAARERDRLAAVLAERARIARDLHDVVAHAVSLMVLQAGAARAVLEPASVAREPLLDVEAAGRQALEDLHRMLGLLRAEEPGAAGPGSGRSPAPDLAALPQLVAGLRRAGLEVEVTRDGAPLDLPDGVSHAAYRVVQEALTNVLKHAGAERAEVDVRYTASALVLEIRDAGGGRASRTGRPEPLARSGVGLLGLRERVSMYGGSLEAGPSAEGGWRVVAELPYADVRPTPVPPSTSSTPAPPATPART